MDVPPCHTGNSQTFSSERIQKYHVHRNPSNSFDVGLYSAATSFPTTYTWQSAPLPSRGRAASARSSRSHPAPTATAIPAARNRVEVAGGVGGGVGAGVGDAWVSVEDVAPACRAVAARPVGVGEAAVDGGVSHRSLNNSGLSPAGQSRRLHRNSVSVSSGKPQAGHRGRVSRGSCGEVMRPPGTPGVGCDGWESPFL